MARRGDLGHRGAASSSSDRNGPSFNRSSNAASQTATDFEHEYRLLMADGRVKHVHAEAHALLDASGNCEFIGAVTDITERKTAEEKIPAARRSFRLR